MASATQHGRDNGPSVCVTLVSDLVMYAGRKLRTEHITFRERERQRDRKRQRCRPTCALIDTHRVREKLAQRQPWKRN